ncbi:HAD hydrolase-like protein [Paludibaculum fermentans]|uniref:HAD hydrolase-like protein n=1 Tax=Paludibaculum fermentans TaxID=1473598 RepID=A0A7S7NUI5_PALFE|nr:HAD hydrolase-like protein [Paludibaculum fermentans]
MHSQIEAILFDFDGVLADTEPLHWACWNEALQTTGRLHLVGSLQRQLHRHLGPSLPRSAGASLDSTSAIG